MRISDWSSDVCSSDLPFLFVFDEFYPSRQVQEWHAGQSEGCGAHAAWPVFTGLQVQGVFLTLVLKLKHCSLLQAQRMGVFGSKGDMRRRTAFGDSRRLHAQFFCAKYVLPGDQVDTACPGLERLGLFGKEWGPGVAGGFIAGWDWVIAINGYEPLEIGRASCRERVC